MKLVWWRWWKIRKSRSPVHPRYPVGGEARLTPPSPAPIRMRSPKRIDARQPGDPGGRCPYPPLHPAGYWAAAMRAVDPRSPASRGRAGAPGLSNKISVSGILAPWRAAAVTLASIVQQATDSDGKEMTHQAARAASSGTRGHGLRRRSRR